MKVEREVGQMRDFEYYVDWIYIKCKGGSFEGFYKGKLFDYFILER